LTDWDKRPTKWGAVASSASRSSAKRRGEAKQKGAPVRGKKTGELTEDPGFAEQPHIARSFTGSDDQNFSSPARAKSRGWRDWWIVRALSATRPSGAATARSQTAEADGCTIVTGG
jgi:hypothetical protein